MPNPGATARGGDAAPGEDLMENAAGRSQRTAAFQTLDLARGQPCTDVVIIDRRRQVDRDAAMRRTGIGWIVPAGLPVGTKPIGTKTWCENLSAATE